MNERNSDSRVNVVTHIHTDASNAEASELNDRIHRALLRLDGEQTRMTWAESFTPITALEQLVQRGRGDHGPVHIVCVTDHMRRQAHHYPDGHLAAAARDHRLTLGAEFATRARDADGEWRLGPEILAYGGPQLVDGPHGPYYGLSQDLIDELYATCIDDDGNQLCTRRAGALLTREGIAHGLSHPFDGHELSLEGTLALITAFPFIETINGGHPIESAQALQALIDLNNALLAGAELPAGALSPLGERVVERIRRRGRWLYPLGGSDSHANNFDRVITTVETSGNGQRPEDVTAGELFGRMLTLADRRPCRRPGGCNPPPSLFKAHGRAASAKSLVTDVVSVVLQNIQLNLRVRKNPLRWAKIIPDTYRITADELRKRSRSQRARMRGLHDEFNPAQLLEQLQAPARIELAACDLPLAADAMAPSVSSPNASSPAVPAMPWPAVPGRLAALGFGTERPARHHAAAQVRCSVKR